MEDGNIESGFSASNHVFEGEFRTGLQEHMYMEPYAALAIPRMECGEMDVYTPTQSMLVAHVSQPTFVHFHS